MKHQITATINSVDCDILRPVWEKSAYRVDCACAAGGDNFKNKVIQERFHLLDTCDLSEVFITFLSENTA